MVSSTAKRILCVDDSKDNCELYDFILSQAGYDVESMQSLSAALQLINSNKFDLYLFDISLVDGTGLELLEKVRAIDSSIPVIICSADTRDSIQEEAKQAGAQVFLNKPIDVDFLVETITQLLNSI
ncbi:response regulator [Nostoc sp. CHAB 5844]|nr:response regulator [Nostoc sp. CHAB 5844]